MTSHPRQARRLTMFRTVLLIGTILGLGWAAPAGQADEQKPLTAQGHVVVRTASVTSAAQGRISEVLIEEGAMVKKGQILFRLEDTRQVLDLKQAEAQLEGAKARAEQVELRRDEANVARKDMAEAVAVVAITEAELARIRKLATTGVVSREEVDKTEGQYKVATAKLEKQKEVHDLLRKQVEAARLVARAEVEAARAAVQQAQAAVQAARIIAPIDGTVIKVSARLGDWTNPAMFGLASSASLCELAESGPLHVQAVLPERE